jgi:hypothetical protein
MYRPPRSQCSIGPHLNPLRRPLRLARQGGCRPVWQPRGPSQERTAGGGLPCDDAEGGQPGPYQRHRSRRRVSEEQPTTLRMRQPRSAARPLDARRTRGLAVRCPVHRQCPAHHPRRRCDPRPLSSHVSPRARPGDALASSRRLAVGDPRWQASSNQTSHRDSVPRARASPARRTARVPPVSRAAFETSTADGASMSVDWKPRTDRSARNRACHATL